MESDRKIKYQFRLDFGTVSDVVRYIVFFLLFYYIVYLVVSVSALTYFIIYLQHLILQFSNNIIFIKTKVLLPCYFNKLWLSCLGLSTYLVLTIFK